MYHSHCPLIAVQEQLLVKHCPETLGICPLGLLKIHYRITKSTKRNSSPVTMRPTQLALSRRVALAECSKVSWQTCSPGWQTQPAAIRDLTEVHSTVG